MRIKALQFKKEDKTEVAIYVYFFPELVIGKWSIGNILCRGFRKRNWVSLDKSFENSCDYKELSIYDREKYKLKKYIDFVGEDKLKEAIMNAWEQIKPDVESIFSSISRNG